MDENTSHQFQIHMPGLLKVLAENLYSTRKVAIRELLQNAHDSCVRRSVEQGTSKYKPRVDIRIDKEHNTLSISDNGSGLTADEITQYLSTIGRSYTRELGEQLSVLSPDRAAELIGQFGLGFLSAFLIGAEVSVITHSMQPSSPALRWQSSGDIHYHVTPAEREGVGTTVELAIKPSADYVLDDQILIGIVRQYADFLPIPIYVEGERLPINLMTPPWDAANPLQATRDYIERVFSIKDPLSIIQLHDQEIDLGHDVVLIPLKGFLVIPARSVASVHEFGEVSVYIRRMFICDHQRDLLPPWARFVIGVIDCPYLQPTASREEIHQEDMFVSVQQAVERQLTEALRRIAENDPTTWKRIVAGHTDVIMGWAVRDEEFFAQVADIVTFRTSRGMLSLPEYLRFSDGTIYYIKREMGSLQEKLLGEASGVPVIDGSWFAVVPFLEKYAALNTSLTLTQLDGEAKQLFRPVDESAYGILLEPLRKQKITVRVAAFKPEAVPALMLYPKDAEFIIETRNALDAGEIPDALSGLIAGYMDKLSINADDLKGTLYLNASNPLIQTLLGEQLMSPAREAVLTILYQIARLFAGRTLVPSDAIAAFEDAGNAIKALLSNAKS